MDKQDAPIIGVGALGVFTVVAIAYENWGKILELWNAFLHFLTNLLLVVLCGAALIIALWVLYKIGCWIWAKIQSIRQWINWVEDSVTKLLKDFDKLKKNTDSLESRYSNITSTFWDDHKLLEEVWDILEYLTSKQNDDAKNEKDSNKGKVDEFLQARR